MYKHKNIVYNVYSVKFNALCPRIIIYWLRDSNYNPSSNKQNSTEGM